MSETQGIIKDPTKEEPTTAAKTAESGPVHHGGSRGVISKPTKEESEMALQIAEAGPDHHGGNLSHDPSIPNLTQSRGLRKREHTTLSTRIHDCIRQHRQGIRLSKGQLSIWRTELVRLFDSTMELHENYVETVTNLPGKRRAECERWEVQFTTDHQSVLSEIDQHLASRSIASSLASSVTINSTVTKASVKRNSTVSVQIQKLETQALHNQDVLNRHGELLSDIVNDIKKSSLQAKRQSESLHAIEQILQSIHEVNEKSLSTVEKKMDIRLKSAMGQMVEENESSSKKVEEKLEAMQKNSELQSTELERLKCLVRQTCAKMSRQCPEGENVSSQSRLDTSIQGMLSQRREALGWPQGITPTSPPRAANLLEQCKRGGTKGEQMDSLGATIDMSNDPSFSCQQQSRGDPKSDSSLVCQLVDSLKMSALPPLTITKFDGNPLNYQMFKSKFMTLYHNRCSDNGIRLAHLQELLATHVLNSVADCVHDPSKYEVIWHRLDQEYCHTTIMAQTHLNNLLRLPPVQPNDSASLKTFSNKLHGAVSALSNSGLASELESLGNLMHVVAKLPKTLRERWGGKVMKMHPAAPSIVDLDDWLTLQSKGSDFAKLMAGPSTLPTIPQVVPKRNGKGYPTPYVSTINHVTTSTPEANLPQSKGGGLRVSPPNTTSFSQTRGNSTCFVCRGAIHKIEECNAFKQMSPTQRAETVFKAGRCLRCLTGRHTSRTCRFKSIRCTVEGCKYPGHSTLLHGSEFSTRTKTSTSSDHKTTPESKPSRRVTFDNKVDEAFLGAVSRTGLDTPRRVLFKIVPVRLQHGERVFDTFGFLDSGSDSTLIRSDVARTQLGLAGPTTKINVTSYDGGVTPVNAHIVDFVISSRDGSTSFQARRAYAVENLQVAQNPTFSGVQAKAFSHLQGLKLPEVPSDQVTILIGLDVADAHDHSESRKPMDGSTGPVAFNTPFGWCLGGKVGPQSEQEQPSHYVAHITSKEEERNLSELVERFWRLESKDSVQPPTLLSAEDRRGEEILKRTSRYIRNHHQIGLMWKVDNPELPDNRSMALSRLFQIERRFKRDPSYAKRYNDVIQEYINLGHARLLSTEEAKRRTPKTNYMPHHGVQSSTSSTTKTRVVFDGSAECEGTSLNKNLLRGPNYLLNLLGIILRFRKHQIPISSDIEKMYHQVLVPDEDQDAFRFLYRSPNSTSPPLTYRMTVHVFGAVSSPSTCLFALNKTAEDNKTKFPDAAASVKTSFYVDNYLDSFESEDEAIKRARQLKELLQLGGFNLTKWSSSSRKVLAALKPLGLANPKLDLDLDKLPMDRALGILWDSEIDAFTFKVGERVQSHATPTKRNLVSVVATVYDPLGFVAPMVFAMKVLIQEVWRAKLDWNEELPESLKCQFQKWCQSLPNLARITIPRCLVKEERPTKQQVHIFADASQLGFGAVAYVRTTYASERVGVSFIMAKTHVAPLKQLSIPRLELQGAVEALHLAILICREMNLDLSQITFHVDSQTVLRWIHSANVKYEVFVGNRIGKILMNTNCRQWRHVPGTMNPADVCSRGLNSDNLQVLQQFHEGPAFLLLEPSSWPKWDQIEHVNHQDPEAIHVYKMKTEPSDNMIDQCVEYYSDKVRLERVLAWCLRFILNCCAKVKKLKLTSGELTPVETETALAMCIRRAQEVAYPEDVLFLKKGKELPNRSKLKQFRPFIDEQHLMRVGGRIGQAPVDYVTRHPVILPPEERITSLIVWDVHVRNYHIKADRLLCELRAMYWVTSGRRVIKSILNKCIPCKRRDVQPVAPLMAQLPIHRITPFLPPFAHTGVDYFGPLTVKVGGRGRRHEKRWICLFTCLTTRAVHLEVTASLSTEAFLMALSRFSSIRGKPVVVYSDNGTNFVAGEKELKEAVEELNNSKDYLESQFTCRHIKWRFSPPSGPHFGGVWERLVQSCKRAMKVTLGNSVVSDQVLNTVVAEIGALLNARPLTHLSINPEDPDPLTPNHFLHARPMPYIPLAYVNLDNVDISRNQFLQSQLIVNHYWKRWITECLPYLTERKKWATSHKNIEVNDIVLVVDPLNPRGQWPLGKVVEILPSTSDNVVRVAKVKISGAKNTLTRPVTRLCLLLTQNDTGITPETSQTPSLPNSPKCEKEEKFPSNYRSRQSN
ncbi:uncharacterized protein LOC130687571 [Daphnia carinata]|uniref:uncharacterized protein LOC130687571 n=1 Tax=Daphnia carinata TaxID=120202 RepID=UPI00257E8352|nr:uncharacterized protein LOC130687571 [Daphnia carinata]